MSKATGRLRWMIEMVEATDRGREIYTAGFKLQMEVEGIWPDDRKWRDVPLVDAAGKEIRADCVIVPWKTDLPRIGGTS